ncbi:MAG TPA: phospholipase D family protein [Bacillota bacterium]|nr:phospholipase D family protein [Bacillota bacterium]
MLNPNDRFLYLEELKPPMGYTLDQAIATTFSLDLLALLFAPLSLAFFEQQDKETLLKDPIAVVEALRRVTDKLTLYCQKGRISIPKADTRLYSYLESIVIEVMPESKEGFFHPKLWLLRYTAQEYPVFYRLICLSRNLTFDRSWDSVLTLEGEVEERKNGFSRNRPLSDFIKRLPGLAAGRVRDSSLHQAELMADEVMRVPFSVPEGFSDDMAFFPLGIKGYRRPFSLDNHARLLMVSPFLSEDILQPLVDYGNNNVLISRAESLDGLDNDFLSRIQSRGSIYVVDDHAEKPEEAEWEEEEKDAEEFVENLSGLHAKLFICEDGWDASLFTGSANATNAAMMGNNVEFMVGLNGKRSQVGIDKFLDDSDGVSKFSDLLRRYQRVEMNESNEIKLKRNLEEALEDARRIITNTDLHMEIALYQDDQYTLGILGDGPFTLPGCINSAYCYPISLKSIDAKDIDPLCQGRNLVYSNVSMVGLTSFVAFLLEAKLEGVKTKMSFVLNLPVDGMPRERDSRILQSIISDKNRFIRYLMFLLAGDDQSFSASGISFLTGLGSSNEVAATIDIPLLEELVRAYSRHPEKIDYIARFIEDLKSTPEGQAVLPEGFDAVWETLCTARREMGTHG